MKKLIHIIASMIFFCAYAMIANAAGWHTATINRIQIKEDKTVLVILNGANHECGSARLIMNDANSPGANWIYSSLLAYHAQNRKVQFYIASCSGAAGLFTIIEDID